MTTVISDTSPINYLCLIEAVEVLPKLFTQVLIPPAVMQELRHPRAPSKVAEWLRSLPPWVKVQAPQTLQPNLGLDAGETEAISLAVELGLPAILIDERSGRLAAERCGLAALGTLNILHAADVRGFLDFETAVEKLLQTNFHVEKALVDTLLREARARRGQ